MKDWKFAAAKTHLSEIVTGALTVSPQRIVLHNDSVVVMSSLEYEKLAGTTKSFKEYLMNGPSFEGLDVSRS